MSRPPAGAAWPHGATRLAGVIGDPVRHSLSPTLHNAAFAALDLDWAYVAFPVPEGSTGAALEGMRALGIDGLSVTMPHKAAAAKACDRLTPTASELGVVNTVVNRNGELIGDATDGPGFVAALRLDEGFEPEGRRFLVLGSGGAARAVVLALARAGAAEVAVAGRTPDRVRSCVALAGDRGRIATSADADVADVVVNATPVGMEGAAPTGSDPDEAPVPIDPAHVGPGQLVVDLVYHPLHTPLIEAARARGATAVSGIGMLIHQAALQFREWTGEDAPLEVMSAAALRALA